MRRPIPPSLGFSGSQIINVASVKGWGNELAINALVYPGERVSWDLGFQVATIRTLEELERFAPQLRQPDSPIFLDCKINGAVQAGFLSEVAEYERRRKMAV